MERSWETFQSFCKEINLEQSIQQELEVLYTEENLKDYLEIEQALTNSEQAEDAYKKLQEKTDGNKQLELLVCVRAAMISWSVIYQPLNISRVIYIDTMSVFSRFMNERKRYYQDTKFDRGFWTWRFISGLIFRVGELEYEINQIEDNIEVEVEGIGKLAGQAALAIHIPSDADISKDKISDSFQDAQLFFNKYFPDFDYKTRYTSTWLLSPVLKKFLKPESKILSFADLFEIVDVNKDSDDAVEWIWGRKDLPIEELSEKTSLQKEAKKWLESGKKLASAMGILASDF